ncbi:hypothetical protein ENBRE01_1468 [Enteropsectra breve]|nr:hypothetical protein ENBRE01_1468 [Enteropsectra breve]
MTSLIFTIELVRLDNEFRHKNRNILLLIDNGAAHPDINSSLTNIKLVFFHHMQQAFCSRLIKVPYEILSTITENYWLQKCFKL